MVRVERGGAGFLTSVTRHLRDLGVEEVFSPALYPGSSRMWVDAGFEEFARLDVFERSIVGGAGAAPRHEVETGTPPWDDILDVDRSAFEGFWAMSRLGLEEAAAASRQGAVLTLPHADGIAGYAIVGTAWGVGYLHRIAVRPGLGGQGMGQSLLTASVNWAAASGARAMVLNVRPDNERARRLYERSGFAATGSDLRVLRHRFQ